MIGSLKKSRKIKEYFPGKETPALSKLILSVIFFIAIAYSIASPNPMLGGRQNRIFLLILSVYNLFSRFKKLIIELFSLLRFFHSSVFLLKYTLFDVMLNFVKWG